MWGGQLNEGTFNLWMLRMKIILVEYIIAYNIPENPTTQFPREGSLKSLTEIDSRS